MSTQDEEIVAKRGHMTSVIWKCSGFLKLGKEQSELLQNMHATCQELHVCANKDGKHN